MSRISCEEKRIIDTSWNFKEANTKEYTHGFHSYPAMMIPQVARRLIEEYGGDATNIVDPFMGSGTTLVEAMLKPKTKQVYGVEINPLAILIAKAKTMPLSSQELTEDLGTLKNKVLNLPEQQNPSFQNISFWFKDEVISKLSKLKASIETIKDDNKKDFFKVCFSETARHVSNTRNSEFKLYRLPTNKLKEHNPDVMAVFEKIAKKNIMQMQEFYNVVKSKKSKVSILKQDTRLKTDIPDSICDFLVTSPPYGDSRTTVAYGQFSRLGSQWLGYEENEVKNVDKNGLGGIPTKMLEHNMPSASLNKVLEKIRQQDEKRAKDVLSFYVDFNKCTDEINRIMKPGSYLCFVVGNRTVKKVNIPTDMIIAELFVNKFGYTHHTTIIRDIPSKRMPKANSPSNKKGELVTTMNHEFIVVLQKK